MNRSKFYTFIFSLVLLFLALNTANAQKAKADSARSSFIIYASYAYQIPGGDMASQYGNNSTIGPGFFYKTDKNWMWTAEMNFIFGSDVKNTESIIDAINTEDGYVIGIDGIYANVRPMERGFTLFAEVGKIIPAFNMNANSGLFFNVGLGYIQHKIRWDVENNNAPQLDEDYKKGYDRFTEGIAFTQSVGLFYLGNEGLWNFKVNAEVVESFTTMKRYNFDTMGGDTKGKVDLFYGLKVAWLIPLYGRAPKAIYYY